MAQWLIQYTWNSLSTSHTAPLSSIFFLLMKDTVIANLDGCKIRLIVNSFWNKYMHRPLKHVWLSTTCRNRSYSNQRSILSFLNFPSPPQAKPDPSAQTSRPPHKACLLRVSSSAFTPFLASPRRRPRPSSPFRAASSSNPQLLGARQGFQKISF